MAKRDRVVSAISAIVGTTEVPIYIEELAQPKPEYKKTEYTPAGLTKGNKKTSYTKEFGSLKAELNIPLQKDFDMSTLFGMCDLMSTNIEGSDNTIIGIKYNPSSSDISTLKFNQYTQRETYKCSGGKATFSMSAKVGDRVMCKYSISSVIDEVVELNKGDEDNKLANPTAKEFLYFTKSLIFKDSLESEANNIYIESFEFSFGAEVVEDMGGGLFSFYIKDFVPTLKVVVKKTLATKTGFNELVNNTSFGLVLEIKDKNENTVYKIIVPNATLGDNVLGNGNGLVNIDKTYNCNNLVGDDNFFIEYYGVRDEVVEATTPAI